MMEDDRWSEIEGKGLHVVKKTTKEGVATARCGAKGKVVDMIGTIPPGRRRPCDRC